MSNIKLGKGAGFRITRAAVFSRGTALAALGYGGLKLSQVVGGELGTDTSALNVTVLVIFNLAASGVILAGLIATAKAGTDKLRDEERLAKDRKQRGASRTVRKLDQAR